MSQSKHSGTWLHAYTIEDKKKNQGASRRRWHRTHNRKGKAKSSTQVEDDQLELIPTKDKLKQDEWEFHPGRKKVKDDKGSSHREVRGE